MPWVLGAKRPSTQKWCEIIRDPRLKDQGIAIDIILMKIKIVLVQRPLKSLSKSTGKQSNRISIFNARAMLVMVFYRPPHISIF